MFSTPRKSPTPMWSRSSEVGSESQGFDSIDFGLELDLHNGSTWSIEWAISGTVNSWLSYAEGPVSRKRSRSAVWDVTDHWLGRGPRDIGSISTARVRDWETDGNTVEVGSGVPLR